MRLLNGISKHTIFFLLIFTPLATGSVQDWSIAFIHLLSLVALTAFLQKTVITWKWHWISTPLDKPIVILIILGILSTVFSEHRYVSIWALILMINYIVIFYLVVHLIQTRDQSHQIIAVITGTAAFLAVFGLFKWAGVNPFPWWEYGGAAYGTYGLESTFGHYNHLAGYMEMAIPLALGLFLTGLKKQHSVLMAILAILLFLSLIFSLSRGGWIGSMVGLLFFAVFLPSHGRFKKRFVSITLIAGFFLIAFIVLSHTSTVERIITLEQKTEISTFQHRIRVWEGVIEMIKVHPLLGTGPGTFSLIFSQFQPPGFERRIAVALNDYLHFTAEVGLFLVPVIAWMCFLIYKNGLGKLTNQSRLVQGMTLGALAGITSILVHSFSDYNMHIPANAILFTVFVAIVAAPVPKQKLSSDLDKE